MTKSDCAAGAAPAPPATCTSTTPTPTPCRPCPRRKTTCSTPSTPAPTGRDWVANYGLVATSKRSPSRCHRRSIDACFVADDPKLLTTQDIEEKHADAAAG